MSSISINRLCIAYEGTTVVDSFDVEVAEGQWLSLIGPNGAGKTSVLRAIANLVSFRGEVCIGGQAVTEFGPRQLARRVAMLAQEPDMPAGMTVAHYVLLGRSPHLGYLGRESDRDRRIVAETLDRLGLGALADRPLDHLSGGERQRVAIVRALAQQAPILLIDEPTSSLDIGRQQSVLELIDRLRSEQRLTVVSAMHDLTLAGQYADRLALMVQGHVVAVGTPAEILTEPAIAKHYQAEVRVVELNGSGRAVVPVRR
ncbi:MAG TPA: ABC transporter ATP-binding protein [Candidatus Dormibacteraeota bacterium]